MLVRPNATKSEVVGFADGVFQVRVAAPPVKGKANKELIAFLSQFPDVSKSNLTILKGHTTKHKVIAIKDLSHEEVMKRLSSSGDTPSKL